VSELSVISGAPGALRQELARRIGHLRTVDPLSPVTVLVGASLQRPFLQRWLAARLGAHANVRILMPGDLALLLGAARLVDGGRRALPPLADRVLLADVARKHPGYFAPVAETPGFGEALFRLVRELRGAGYDLADLGPLLDGATDAAEKAASLTEILASFEQRRAGFYGPHDALVAADPARLDGLALLVYGMLEVPPTLERLIVRVAERMPVAVLLPDPPAAEQAPVALLRRRLIEQGAVHTALDGKTEAGMALDQLRAVLFTPPSKPGIEPDGTVQLVSAPDPAREVRAAARACLEWAVEGVEFWEMAVAYRHGEAYRPLVEAVLIEAGIPLYLHEGSPLAERPLGRQTLGLLDLYDSDLSRQSVMDFLTDAWFPDALREQYGGSVPAARWDSVSRQAGIVGGAEQWGQRLAALQRDLAGDDAQEDQPDWVRDRIADADQLRRFIAELDRQLLAHPGRAPWAAHLSYLRELLATYVSRSEEIVIALRGLERFTALEAEVEFDRFLDVVRRALETLRSEDVLDGQPGAFARRGVNVVAVNSLPGIEFRRLWVLGAAERSFPPPARQDPILLDEERAEISKRAGALLAPRAERGSEEELGFALASEAARERLVVSYARRATGESRPRLPSVFFREVASQLVGERVSAEDAPLLHRPDVHRIGGDAIGVPIPGGRYAETPETVSAAAQLAISDADRDRTYLQAAVTQPVAIATFEEAAPAFGRALRADHARRSNRYSEWDGAIGPDALASIASLVPHDRVLSPTALENYAACPQRFLMGDVLRIRSVEEPERTVRIDNMRRGNLFHRILQRFDRDWDGDGPAALAPDAADRMRAIAREECARAEERGETGYPAMWRADRLEVIEDCLRWLELERQDPLTRALSLVKCEARFGRRHPGEADDELSRDEPIEIELGDRTLLVSGRIDRLNWDAKPPTRFRVIDYKTGKVRDEKPAQLQGGRMLQLPLYVLASAELLGIDPSAGEAAYVYPTRRGGFRTIGWEADQLAERRDDVIGLLAAIVDGVARGDFMVAPWKESSACTYCDFKPICPRGPEAYMERRAADPRLATFAERIRGVQ
jgi:ATP-dependent helicase/nuclease subunit B